MKNIYVLFIALCLLAGCSKNTDKVHNELISPEFRNERLGVQISQPGDGVFRAVYDNGEYLAFNRLEEGRYKVSGSRLGGRNLILEESEENILFPGSLGLIAEHGHTQIGYSELHLMVNGGLKSPCKEHDSEESLKECFDREWDEFCDSFVSCVFRNVNAPVVALLIGIHCLVCNEM